MATVTLDDIVLTGATRADSSGAWNAPENTAETGFEYSSYVRAEPIEASFEVWIDDRDLRRLEQLRERGEPFPASIDHVNLSLAKLSGLDIEREGRIESHRKASIQIKEVNEAEIRTAEISIDTEAGAMGSSASDVEPSVAYPQDDTTGTGDDVTGGGGIVGALSNFRESLSSIF